MNWLVALQLRCENPAVVSQVQTYVVIAETESGVRAEIEERHKGYMIRWMRPEKT